MQLALAIVASFAALGGFLFGCALPLDPGVTFVYCAQVWSNKHLSCSYDLGLIGGAILVIRNEFGTSKIEDAFIVGAAKVGAFVGVFLGGAYMYRYGRKAAILADSIFFAIGPLVMAGAMSVAMLVLGRFLVGMGIGFSAVVVPAYLGEVAQPNMRGSVVTLYELMLCVGMVLSSLADAALEGTPGSWRWMVGLPVVPGLGLALAPLVLPESPRWLLMAGDMPSALAALHKLRCSRPQKDSTRSTQDVENELVQLWKSVEQDQASCLKRVATDTPDRHHSRDSPTIPLDSTQPTITPLPRLPSTLSVQSETRSGVGAATSRSDAAVNSQREQSTFHTVVSVHDNRKGRGIGRRLDSYAELPELLQMEWQHRGGVKGSRNVWDDLECAPSNRATEEEHVQLLGNCSTLADTSKSHNGHRGGVLRAVCTPVDTEMHAMHAPPTTQSADTAAVPGCTHATHALHDNRSESGLLDLVAAGGTPQPCCSHGMHTVHGVNSHLAETLADTSHGKGNGCCTLAGSWLGGLCPRRRTHGANAQAVPGAPTLGTSNSKGQYNMRTPIHLVMWHMLWDCQRLVIDAFTVQDLGKARAHVRMHEWHALSQVPQNDKEGHALNDRSNGGTMHAVDALAADVDREDSAAHYVQQIAERRAVRIAVLLAFFNQISASTAIMNYAPVLLKDVGVASSELAMELSAIISCAKTVGIILGVLLIDRVGRRLLLVSGSVGCALCMFSLAAGVWFTSYIWTLTSVCLYILTFSTCWAGVFWVVCSEIFSMSIKSPAMSLATASLFLSGAVADFSFPMLLFELQSGTFVIFGCLAALGGVYVHFAVPETKGLTLQEVQAVLQFQE